MQQKIQQEAMHKVIFEKYIPTEPLFNNLKVLNLQQQKFVAVGGFMWLLKNDMVAETLNSQFCSRNSIWPIYQQISYSSWNY